MVHPKAALIERLQRDGRGLPQFTTEREGPEHEPLFRSVVSIQGKPSGEGTGGNKREAERRAALAALEGLDGEGPPTSKGKGVAAKKKARGKTKAAANNGGATPKAAATPAIPAFVVIEPDPGAFDGPWPLYEQLLVESLRVANARVDANLRGDVALLGIESFALKLYKNLLENLGEVVEDG